MTYTVEYWDAAQRLHTKEVEAISEKTVPFMLREQLRPRDRDFKIKSITPKEEVQQ